MWFGVGGEERGLDGNKAVAAQAVKCGVPITFAEYEGMPHEWMILLRHFPQANHCFEAWAGACINFGNTAEPASRTILVHLPSCVEDVTGDVAGPASLEHEELRKRMRERSAARPI